jgi:hypothetical protein
MNDIILDANAKAERRLSRPESLASGAKDRLVDDAIGRGLFVHESRKSCMRRWPSHKPETRCGTYGHSAETASICDVANFGRDMVIDVILSRSVIVSGITLDKSAFVQPEPLARKPRKRCARRATSVQAASSYGGQPRTFC